MEDKLLLEVRAKAQQWLDGNYDENTQKQVRAMLDNSDTTELIESFYKDLEFGTGGLRGIMGAGTNRMNIYTMGAATQGLANYLIKEFGKQTAIKVVLATIVVIIAACLPKRLPIFFLQMALKCICLKT